VARIGVALGHTRLAIIDLSEGGKQPMTTDDGCYTLVFNGEIYNYRELRRELETQGEHFRSASDTEVLLLGYRRWGENFSPDFADVRICRMDSRLQRSFSPATASA